MMTTRTSSGPARRGGPQCSSFRPERCTSTSRAGLEEGQEIIRSTFGGKYERLAGLKAKYDPQNMFHLNQNIKPQDG
jgi:hypothetical protein